MTRTHLRGLAGLVCTTFLVSACQHLPDSFPLLPRRDIETHRFEAKGDVIGQLAVMSIKVGDTLPDVARHFALGHDALAAANPDIDVWLPEPGQQVVLPLKFVLPDAPRQGVVLNLASMRLFYYPSDSPDSVVTYPVGIGREGWSTPQGNMHIIEKMTNPVWRVPISIRREHARNGDPLPAVVPAGPDNPLGEHAVRLSRPSYLIHSTNKPYGVGMRISHGCIRLYPENMRALFPALDLGTKVNIVHQPYLVGWQDGVVYVEAHKPLDKNDSAALRASLKHRLAQLALWAKQDIDWDRIDDILSREQGIPTPVNAGHSGVMRPTRVTHPGRLRETPVIPAFDEGAWYVEAGVFDRSRPALRIAAMLNHQGPPIPARVLNRDGKFRIWAGPYAHRDVAQEVAERIGRDLYLETRLQPPTHREVTSQK